MPPERFPNTEARTLPEYTEYHKNLDHRVPPCTAFVDAERLVLDRS